MKARLHPKWVGGRDGYRDSVLFDGKLLVADSRDTKTRHADHTVLGEHRISLATESTTDLSFQPFSFLISHTRSARAWRFPSKSCFGLRFGNPIFLVSNPSMT